MVFRFSAQSAFAVLVVFLLAVTSEGQQTHKNFWQELDEVRNGRSIRVGPLRIFPVFRVSEAGYDSNVYYRDSRDEVVPDYTAVLSPTIRAFWLFGDSAVLSFTENPEYSFFAKEETLRAFTNSYASELRLRLLGGLVLSGSYEDSRHLRRAYSEFDRRVRDLRQGMRMEAFWETPRGTALGLSLDKFDFSYKTADSGVPDPEYGAALDRTEKSGFFEFDYRLFSQSFLFLRAGFSEYEFVHPEFAGRNATSFQAVGGIRLPVSGRVRGGLSLGWKKFTPESPDRKVFSGLVGEGDVDFRIGILAFKLAYLRDNFFSYLDQAYYYIEDRITAGVRLYLTSFLRLDYARSYGRLSFPEPVLVWQEGLPVVVESRQDTLNTDQIGLVLRISGSFGLGLNLNLYRRGSNAPGYNIDRNFFGAYLTYDF